MSVYHFQYSKWTISQSSQAFQAAKEVTTGVHGKARDTHAAISQGSPSPLSAVSTTTTGSLTSVSYQLHQVLACSECPREIFTGKMPRLKYAYVQDIGNNSRQCGAEQGTRATLH